MMNNDQGFWPLELPENEKITPKTLKLIEQLERENGEYQNALGAKVYRLEGCREIEKERDALAAHVQSLNKSLLWFIEVIETDFMPDLEDYAELEEEISEAKKLATQSTKTSLSEHDIEVKLKAIEEAVKAARTERNIQIKFIVLDWLDQHAAKIRNGKDGE